MARAALDCKISKTREHERGGTMVHGYHVIWGMYGFWLPNDPRGSWSDFVAHWELLRFGTATHVGTKPEWITPARSNWRCAARSTLKYPAVTLTGEQALSVANGFATLVQKSGLTVWACAIMPEHVHLVIARHRYEVEQMCNLLKGAATKQLKADRLHPQSSFSQDGKLPSMWSEGQWKSYLDSESAIEAAIHYVEQNPIREGKRLQCWSWVTPFAGIHRAGWTTYH